jgi:hypothetical protein
MNMVALLTRPTTKVFSVYLCASTSHPLSLSLSVSVCLCLSLCLSLFISLSVSLSPLKTTCLASSNTFHQQHLRRTLQLPSIRSKPPLPYCRNGPQSLTPTSNSSYTEPSLESSPEQEQPSLLLTVNSPTSCKTRCHVPSQQQLAASSSS